MKSTLFLLSFAIISSLTAQNTVTIDSAIQRNILIEHNKERKLLNIPNLIWNDEIAAYAEEWALQLAEEDKNFYFQTTAYQRIALYSMEIKNLDEATIYLAQ